MGKCRPLRRRAHMMGGQASTHVCNGELLPGVDRRIMPVLCCTVIRIWFPVY